MNRPPLSRSVLLRRWLSVLLRGLHLVAVMALGAALLGAPHPTGLGEAALAGAVAATGFAHFALDLWRKPGHLGEVAGLAVLAKLVLVAWMAADAAPRLALFWTVVLWSAVFSHAPATFRHKRLL